MAVISLSGWFGGSERDDDEQNVASLGGCVGTDIQWKIQDEAWNEEVLAAFGLDYVHMKEVQEENGKFAQFKDKERSRQLAEAIIGTFKKSGIRPFGSVTRLKDLRSFNRERKLRLSAYPLNIYSCMFMVRHGFRHQLAGEAQAVLNLDRREGTAQAAETARHYAKTDPNLTDVYEKVLPSPLPEEGLASKTPALQAADFVAWKILTQEKERRFSRRSKHVFAHETPVIIWRWSYNVLCLMDAGRGGVWTERERKRRVPSAASRGAGTRE